MGKQVTEMLKGTLEGIRLAILSGRSAYGISEGTFSTSTRPRCSILISSA